MGRESIGYLGLFAFSFGTLAMILLVVFGEGIRRNIFPNLSSNLANRFIYQIFFLFWMIAVLGVALFFLLPIQAIYPSYPFNLVLVGFILIILITIVSHIPTLFKHVLNPRHKENHYWLESVKSLSFSLFAICLIVFGYQLLSAILVIENTFESLSTRPTSNIDPQQWKLLIAPDAITISFIALIISSLGVLSTQVLGWRNDVRNRKEVELRREKLELEIAKLRKELEESKILIKRVLPEKEKRQLTE